MLTYREETRTKLLCVMLESEIQRKCIEFLNKAGWLSIKIIQCNLNGFPDLITLRDGRIVFIEFKQPGKNPEPLQEYRIKKLREQGFEVIICRGQADVSHLQ